MTPEPAHVPARSRNESPDGGSRLSAQVVALVLAMLASAALLLWLQRGRTFYFDELYFLTTPGDGSLREYFASANGHLIAVPLFLNRAILEVGSSSYFDFGVVQVIGACVVAGLVFEYCRRRIGSTAALFPAVFLLFFGSSWPNLLQPVVGLLAIISAALGLGALLLLERGNRRAGVVAAGLLCLAVGSFAVAFTYVAAAGVSLLVQRRRTELLWVVGAPAVIYLAWRASSLGAGGGDGAELSNVIWLPAYFVDSVYTLTTAVIGLPNAVSDGPLTYMSVYGFSATHLIGGLFLAAAEFALLYQLVRWIRARGPVNPMLWVAVTVLASQWAAQGLTLAEHRTPGEIRYFYPGLIGAILVVAEVARGWRPRRAWRPLIAGVVVIALGLNVVHLFNARASLDSYTRQARADMAVLVLAGDRVSPAFDPSRDAKGLAPATLTVSAGRLQGTAERFGSPGFSAAELLEQPDDFRVEADRLAALATFTVPIDARAIPLRGCRPLAGSRNPRMVAIDDRWVRFSPGPRPSIALGRFADGLPVSYPATRSPTATALGPPPDGATPAWRLRLGPGPAAELCRLVPTG